MKTKIIILAVVAALFTISVASTQVTKGVKAEVKKEQSAEPRANKGLAMEDKDQFN